MITPRPHNQRNSSYQYQQQYGYATSNNNNGHGADPQLPFPPPVPPPPLPPTAATANGSSWGGYNNNNNSKTNYMPGGTWQTAAIYSGAYTSNQYMGSLDQSSPEYQQHFGVSNQYQNTTAPIGHQVPPYIANKESFPHQQQNREGSQYSNHSDNGRGNNNHNNRRPQTASGLEVHAMQRLVSSAKTRFGPSGNGNNNNSFATDQEGGDNSNFYEQGQDYFASNQTQNNAQIAEQHARREQLLNSHRNSGGVAFEMKLKTQRERNISSGRGPVVKSVIGLDGTFRRTSTPNPSSSSYNNTSSATHSNNNMSKLSHLRKERNERYIPLSQAQTSQLVNKTSTRPSSAAAGTTVKARLKGEAPDLKRSLAEGFAMRFQPEQIEQMKLPDSVGEAALEISRYRTAAGGYDNTRRQNPGAPDSSYINGLGDMFTKMKGQYLQMQKLGGGGGNNKGSGHHQESPIPRNPQQQLFKRPGAGLEGGGNNGITSPLKAGGSHVFGGGNNNNNNSSYHTNTTNHQNASHNMTHATRLYSIAGTGAFREQQNNNNDGFSPENGMSYSPKNRSTKEMVRFEAPQPSARALALRAELEALEAQWKDLHQDQQQQQQHNNSKSHHATLNDSSASGLSPEPHHPSSTSSNNNTRDQVLSRINAVLR